MSDEDEDAKKFADAMSNSLKETRDHTLHEMDEVYGPEVFNAIETTKKDIEAAFENVGMRVHSDHEHHDTAQIVCCTKKPRANWKKEVAALQSEVSETRMVLLSQLVDSAHSHDRLADLAQFVVDEFDGELRSAKKSSFDRGAESVIAAAREARWIDDNKVEYLRRIVRDE